MLGIGFDLPTGWQTFRVDDIDPTDTTARTVAEQLGVRPRQLERRLATTELYLVSEAHADEGFLPTIDVYPGRARSRRTSRSSRTSPGSAPRSLTCGGRTPLPARSRW